jgi:hypothetical protein
LVPPAVPVCIFLFISSRRFSQASSSSRSFSFLVFCDDCDGAAGLTGDDAEPASAVLLRGLTGEFWVSLGVGVGNSP